MKTKRGKCLYCRTFAVAKAGYARTLKLCEQCFSDKQIVAGREKARNLSKEISAGLPKLYRELRNGADNER